MQLATYITDLGKSRSDVTECLLAAPWELHLKKLPCSSFLPSIMLKVLFMHKKKEKLTCK